MINQMTIIGLGLVGKSIIKAISNASFVNIIVGFDEDPSKAEGLLNSNTLDVYDEDLVSAVKNADLIIITLPFARYEEIFQLLATNIKETAVITDIASIKSPIIQLAKTILGTHYPNFVPSHPIMVLKTLTKNIPMPDIFAERPVIITATEEANPRSLNLVMQFWQKMGGEIEFKTAAENDAIIATVSHLPQILAFTFINSLNDNDHALRYITKNFVDFTSIAMQSPVAWSDICIANRQAILKELTKFESRLKKLKKILETENSEILLEHFNTAKQLRENI